ncbi:hypothetical protein V3C99_000543 [Haemonchus contortus]
MEKGKSAKELTAISSSKRPSASDTGSDTTSKPLSLVEDVTGGSSTTARSKTLSVARTTPSSIPGSKPRSGKSLTATAKSPMHRKSRSTKSLRHGKSKSLKSKKSFMGKVLSRSLGLSPARSLAQSRSSSTPKSPSSRIATLMQDVIETQDIESIFEATTVYKPAVPLESFWKSATDAIVIVALLCSTDTLFSFPIEVLRNGGYFFLIIYFFFAFLISFPILHLELFVSQYLQSGILKSFLLYGSGYTGFGISILLLTVVNQNLSIHKGYYYLNHAIKLYDGVEMIVDCKGSSYVQCESLYNNKICKDIDGHGNVFVEGACKNVTGKADRIERAANVQSSMMAYIERFMLDSQLNVNLSIIGFEYAFLFFCACFGVKGLRSVLIATFIFIALYFLSLIWETPPIEDVLSILRMSSNPVALFRIETYLTAFRLSIQTYGHCVYGLFCFSSFRNRNGRSYQTAIMVFWLMMFAAALSLYTTMMFILKVNDMQLDYISTTTSISTNTIGIRFAVAALTEYTALVSMDTWGYLILSYLLFLLMDLTSVFGVIFAIFAIMRDFSPKCQRADQRLVAFGYICCSCLFYAVFTMHLADGEKTVEESIVTYSKYFFIAIEIFIFVHAYGEHEFEVDVVEVLGEESGSIFNPTLLIFAYRHSLIAMIAMQAIECNRLSGWLQFRNLYETVPDKVDSSSMTKSVVFLLPLFLPLVVCVHQLSSVPSDMEISEIFSVSESHPSHKRIQGAFVVHDMAGDNLLDRTPPEEPLAELGSADDKTLKTALENEEGLSSVTGDENTAPIEPAATEVVQKTAIEKTVSHKAKKKEKKKEQGITEKTTSSKAQQSDEDKTQSKLGSVLSKLQTF